MVDFAQAKQLTQNKWNELLPRFGVDTRFLINQHGPCPICGGKDRFRYDDRGSGSYFCSGCGAGDGFDLLYKLKGISMFKVLREADLLGNFHEGAKSDRDTRNKNAMRRLWEAAEWVPTNELGALYLKSRGIAQIPSNCFKIAKSVFHKESNQYYPALLAKVCGPDNKVANIHITYLTPDGSRPKIEPSKKVMAGSLPAGSAIKLFPFQGGELGIAEGIETALSCFELFGIPTWAAINANMLTKWIPPENVKRVWIFGDYDSNYTGHARAYELAHKLSMRGFDVKIAFPDAPDTDFNDVLQARLLQVRGPA